MIRAAVVGFAMVGLMAVSPAVMAHDGGLDEFGCHQDHERGEYHCHQGLMARRTFRSRQEMLETFKKEQQRRKDKPAEQPK